MELQTLKAKLSVKSIELENAIDAGQPRSQLIKIYRELKELQYQLIMFQVNSLPKEITR